MRALLVPGGGGGGGGGGLAAAGPIDPGVDVCCRCDESNPGLLWSRSASIFFTSPRIVCKETAVGQQQIKSGLH